MHYWNGELFAQLFFNIETFGSLDVLKVDSSKSGLECFYYLNKFLRVFFIDLYIENVDVCENFKQYAFPFHYRLASFRSNIAKAQYSSAITDHRNEIPFSGILIDGFFIGCNFFTGFGYTWRIS